MSNTYVIQPFMANKPLAKCSVTQPFGVNYTGVRDFYTKIGLKAHNGTDFSAPMGTNCFAVCDGEVTRDGNVASGYGLNIRLVHELGLQSDGSALEAEVVYGHLQKITRTGKVNAGDAIGECDNTGYSTGSHLHLGVRFRYWAKDGSGPHYLDYDNGYFGGVNPMAYFLGDPCALPVDYRYGMAEKDRGYSDLEWYKVNAWIWRNTGKLATVRQKNALVWGRWDWRNMSDPAMFDVWANMTKMEAQARNIIK